MVSQTEVVVNDLYFFANISKKNIFKDTIIYIL